MDVLTLVSAIVVVVLMGVLFWFRYAVGTEQDGEASQSGEEADGDWAAVVVAAILSLVFALLVLLFQLYPPFGP